MNNEMTTKSPDMSNEEVIDVLKGMVFNSFDRTTPKEREALDFAIKSLEEKPQCWTPCPNKEERPQGDCENCDFHKFSEKFVDTFVDLMTKNDIASVEQLSEILKGGTE